jgi:hypothetical protein
VFVIFLLSCSSYLLVDCINVKTRIDSIEQRFVLWINFKTLKSYNRLRVCCSDMRMKRRRRRPRGGEGGAGRVRGGGDSRDLGISRCYEVWTTQRRRRRRRRRTASA